MIRNSSRRRRRSCSLPELQEGSDDALYRGSAQTVARLPHGEDVRQVRLHLGVADLVGCVGR
jgi:hypothetical protein